MATWAASSLLELLYLGVVAGTIIVIVLGNRNPVRTLAWILVLTFLPFVGLLLYFFFGRAHRKERRLEKKVYNRLLKKPMAEYLAQEVVLLPDKFRTLITLFQQTNQAFPFDGNRVTTYTEGRSLLISLLKQLSAAEKHIHMEYYIFEDDAVGRLIRDVLIEKALNGVEVRVIYDDVGCWHVPQSFFEKMREAGIETHAFLKVRFPLLTSKVNYRNHRKVVVIDGKVGFIGGMNLAERYVKGTAWGKWRDTHLMLQGKAVHGLQTTFLLDWFFVDRTLLSAARYFPPIENVGSSLVQIVTSDPIAPKQEIMRGLVLALANAKRYFYIQSPYFLPTENILHAMQTAALAGVDVRLMLPSRGDNRLTHWASCSYLEDMLRAGVKVFFYRPGFLHSKLMVTDDAMFTAGSTNTDFRSFEPNFEVNAFVYDPTEATLQKELFLSDQRQCEQLFLKSWLKRGKKKEALESVVRLFAPLL